MGCHTYTNIPIKENQDKTKQLFLDKMNEEIVNFKKLNKTKKFWVKQKYFIKSYNCQVIDWRILKKRFLYKYRQIEKYYDKGLIHPYYKYIFKNLDGADKDYMWYNNTIYVHQCSDFFRIMWYDAPYCHSLEETLRILDYYNTKISPNEQCILTKDQMDELKQFWYTHPDGIISFH